MRNPYLSLSLCLMALVGVCAVGDDQFSFLLLGDIHYESPGFASAVKMKAISDDMRNKGYKPDFICHTGDFIENQRDNKSLSLEDGGKEWEFGIADIKKNFSIPFFMSPGNHDWYGGGTWFGGMDNIVKYYYSFMEKELGNTINGKPFYSFRWENSYFLFINHVGFDYGLDKEQELWLDKCLSYADNNPTIKHVFLFSHPNLWNIGYFRYNENFGLIDIIKRHKKIDAYFCGHTHHSNASVWKFDTGLNLLQINNGAVKIAKNKTLGLSPIEDKYLILNPPPSRRGYTKGFTYVNGYFIVSVNGPKVVVGVELIDGKRVWEFEWTSPGEIKENIFLAERHDNLLKSDELKDIADAGLYIYSYIPEAFLPQPKTIEIIFNKTKVGNIPRHSDDWSISLYNKPIKIPVELVKTSNVIEITNPNHEYFAIRDCYLSVTLASKKEIFTPVYPKVLVAGDWKDMYMGFGLSHPTAGVLYSSFEANVPEEMIETFDYDKNMKFKMNFK